jgi:hypothetical protein
VEIELSHWRVRVDPLGQRAELDLLLVQAGEELDRLEHRAAEPVHLPDHERVALTQMGQGGIQAPAVPLRARLLVGEDPARITAGRFQGIDLQI